MMEFPAISDSIGHTSEGRISHGEPATGVARRPQPLAEKPLNWQLWSLIDQSLGRMVNAGSLDHLVQSLDALVFSLDQLGAGYLLDRYIADGHLLPASAHSISSLRSGVAPEAVLHYLRGERATAGDDAIVNDLRRVLPMLIRYETRPEMATRHDSGRAVTR